MNKLPNVGDTVLLRHVSNQNKSGLAFLNQKGRVDIKEITQVMDNGKVAVASGDIFEVVPNQVKGKNAQWMSVD